MGRNPESRVCSPKRPLDGDFGEIALSEWSVRSSRDTVELTRRNGYPRIASF